MTRVRRITTPQAKPAQVASNGESVFQDENYYRLMGVKAGKQAKYAETRLQAIKQAKGEFESRKLLKHEKAFIEGFVSSIRDGFFTENEHIEKPV